MEEKKMSNYKKKQLKEIEEAKKAQRRLRWEMTEALKSYWEDIAAMERVAKITGNKDALLMGGQLVKQEKEKLFNNYEVLKDLTTSQLSALRIIIHNEEQLEEFLLGSRHSIMKEQLPADAIWIKDIIWKEEEFLEQLELFKRIGITKIYYTDHSTATLRAMVWFTRAGAKIIGTTNISEYEEGLIIEL